MDIFWEELTYGIPDGRQLIHIVARVLAATLLGAVIGYQRERTGKPAGLKTHMLVTLGTTVFVLASANFGMTSDGLSRVIQGIVTGIGFIGAGSIIKLKEERDIQGLTTASSVWMASAIGVAVGLGMLGLAIITTILTFAILSFLGSLDRLSAKKSQKNNQENQPAD